MGRFEYHADQVDGNVLMFLDQEQSWVEKIKESTKLFWCCHPQPDLWEKLHASATNIVVENFLEPTGKLGIAQQLAEERITGPFTLPPMLSLTDEGYVIYGTGMSRITAEIMCATPLEEISMIIACENETRVKSNFLQYKEITTTKEFEQIYNLQEVDYSIVWQADNEAKVRFINSIVKHSIYEAYQETDKYFVGMSNQRSQYLDIFSRNSEHNKIEVNVYCVRDQEKFFTHSDSKLQVNFLHQPSAEWTFSYGRLMGAFRPSAKGQESVLNVWAFDINQPVNLYMLLMWASSMRPSYYTKNRKLTVFNPTNVTSIKEIPDLVK